MKEQQYSASIEVSKNPADVFNCITNVSKWWSKDFEGNSSTLNDEFIINHPGTHYSKQKLVEVIPAKKMVWLVTASKLDWLDNNKEEWTGTKMIFEITFSGNNTVINFTHEGLIPGMECYSRVVQGWDMVVKDWLFNFISHGKTI
jgi:hypothetical protein